MYKNKANDGTNNVCGRKIAYYRMKMVPKTSQRLLAERMQTFGVDIDKNAVQRIESGSRFVTDIELRVFAQAFGVTYSDLLD